MMTVSASSLKVANPEQKKERIKNDLKYSWAMSTVAGAGTAAAAIGFYEPQVYKNGYNATVNFVKSNGQKAIASPTGQKVLNYVKKAADYIKAQATKLSGTKVFGQIKDKMAPTMNFVKTKWASLKSEGGKFVKFVADKLAKVPTNYKIAGAIALATLALVTSLSNKHAYNAGKIDGHYEGK